MRRHKGRMNGEQYLGNTSTTEIHDLDNENTNCQIDEILRAGNEKPFSSRQEAYNLGYDNCYYCIGNSRR
jgi:hypothetical protein